MKKALWTIIVIIALLIIAYLFATLDNETGEDEDNIINISLEERAERAGLTVTEDSILVDLSEESDSEISGVAVLTELDDAQTEVAVWLDDEEALARPAHIHSGSCSNLGDIVYPLTDVTDGLSNTTLTVDFEELATGAPLAINAHESDQNLGTSVACGEIDFEQDLDDATGTDADDTATTTDDGEAETVTVRYGASGFTPATVTVSEGDTVVWMNESAGDMWVASDVHPTHSVFSGTALSEHCPDLENDDLDQCETGDEFSFTFTEAGEWNYHNHRSANHSGTVIVE